MTQPSDRRERYATAIHDAMETDLSLVDQEPAYQALIARAAEAAEALADAEQNRQFLTTLANLGIATHRLDRIRDAARLHRQQLLGTSELYAVIAADDEPEQCPRSEFDGYGLQCQKPAGHNLCTFEEQPAAGARQDETERCAHCNHPKGDHDGRADHRAKHSPLVAGEPWCHACNGQCDYAAGARQDGAQPADPPCVCGHTKSQHPKISGRLLCDECDPDSTENLTCEEFDAL